MEWLRRYLPAEIAGTVGELGAAAFGYVVSGSLVVAAFAATIGANVGYYGLAYCRAHRAYLGVARPGGRPSVTGATLMNHVRASGNSVRSVVIEFGPGELVDSVLVRPGLFLAVPILAVALGMREASGGERS